jgi:hypothetical protein
MEASKILTRGRGPIAGLETHARGLEIRLDDFPDSNIVFIRLERLFELLYQ